VEKIAINAVMAGCEPAYMPAILATVDAILDPAFDAYSIQTTTNPVGPMIVFNGPVRNELGINCGAGCFGPGTQANATIGRALRLVMLNLGGAKPGEVDKSPLGWPGKYTSCCIGENEEDSPWEPFHIERGFRASDSTVTVIPVNGMWSIAEPTPEPEQMLHHVTHGMALSGPTAGAPPHIEQVLVVSPGPARMIARLQPTKEALRRHIFEQARISMRQFAPYRHDALRAYLREHGFPVAQDLVPICEKPEDILIFCAGGTAGYQSCGLSAMFGHSVMRKIG
jgi:hypothetical protein